MQTSASSSTPVFILDVGTRSIKAGLSTRPVPHVTASVVGTPKYPRCLPGPSFNASTSSLVVGQEAYVRRGVLHLSRPVQHGGVITDWTGAHPLLRQSIHGAVTDRSATTANNLATSRASSVKDGTDLIYSLVERPFASRPQRARLAELLFEGGANDGDHEEQLGPRAAGMFCGVGPLLALYATGQTTGLVVDVGDGAVSTAAAVDGYVLTPCLQQEADGATGEAMTSYLTRLLYQNGVLGATAASSSRTRGLLSSLTKNWSEGASAGTQQERELVYAIKEACCSVAAAPLEVRSAAAFDAPAAVAAPSLAALNAALIEAAKSANATDTTASAATSTPFTLPDGHEIQVGVAEATQAVEVLFYPFLVGREGRGVVEIILGAVDAAPAEVRPQLLGNIVLTGGASCVPGFAKRVFHELQQRRTSSSTGNAAAMSVQHQRVCVTAPEQRAYAAWLGASFVAQLSTFASQMVVPRATYEEEGESALAKKMLT